MASTRSKLNPSIPEKLKIDTSSLTKEGKQIAAVIINHIASYFDSVLKGKDAEIEKLTEKMCALEDKVEKLEDALDAAAASERRDNLIVSGNVPPHSVGENTKQVLISLLQNKLNLNVDSSDISIVHRVGVKSKTQGPDKRNILIKLCRHDLKGDILSACKQMKPDIYINESLTPIRSNIIYILRKAKRRYPKKIAFCRSFDGNVVVFLPNNQKNSPDKFRRVVVNSKNALQIFLQSELSTSISELESDE